MASVIASYGDIEVVFSSYDKFVFRYVGKLVQGQLLVCCGGDGATAYEHSCSADYPNKVKRLDSIISVEKINGILSTLAWSN